MNITETLIDYIENISQADFPSEIKQKVKNCFIDYLGVLIVGSYTQKDATTVYLNTTGDTGKCSVFGTGGIVTTSHLAAFLNAYNAHISELDDGHRYGMLHLGAPIFSAVLAAVQSNVIVGWDNFYHGIIVAYETAIKLAKVIQPNHKLNGYHTTGTCGTIGAAIAIAVAGKYSRTQMLSTLACAATSAAGLLELIDNTSELKPYNVGRASMDGLNAAMWGKIGYIPPQDSIGGKRGFLNVMANGVDKTIVFPKEPEILNIYTKPYAACRHCHSAIDAALIMRPQIADKLDQVRTIHILSYKLAMEGHIHTEVNSASSAKMSIPYSVAAAFVLGHANIDAFSSDTLKNQTIRMLINKTMVSEDASLTALCPDKRATVIVIKMADGKEITERVEYAKGEPENAMSEDEIDDKTISLFLHARKDEQIARAIIHGIRYETLQFDDIIKLCG